MAKRRKTGASATAKPAQAESYQHPESKLPLRPDVGTQPQFKKKKPPQRYRYDSSLSPALEWDGENPARELAEWLLRQVEEAAALGSPLPPGEGQGVRAVREFKGADGKVLATVASLRDAVEQLKRLSRPFLNWSGKAERLSLRRADAAAVRPRAALHQGHHRDAQGPQARQAGRLSRPLRRSRSTRSPTRCCAPTSTATSG